MKSFIQFILEGAAVGKGSPWALAKGSVGKKPTPTKKKKEKPSSAYDVGHYNKAKDMKQVDLYHVGSRTGYGEINHHTHWKESNKRRAKQYEGRLNPHNARHETWKKTTASKGHREHFAQGRIDHKIKKYTVTGSNDKMEERAREHVSKKYPEYSEHQISE